MSKAEEDGSLYQLSANDGFSAELWRKVTAGTAGKSGAVVVYCWSDWNMASVKLLPKMKAIAADAVARYGAGLHEGRVYAACPANSFETGAADRGFAVRPSACCKHLACHVCACSCGCCCVQLSMSLLPVLLICNRGKVVAKVVNATESKIQEALRKHLS